MRIETDDGEAVAFTEDVAVVTIGAHGPRVRSWRYRINRDEHGDWSVFYLEGDGRLVVHSSFGAYAHRWEAIGDHDFRAWLASKCEYEASAENTAMIGKLAKPDWFDAEAANTWFEQNVAGYDGSITCEEDLWVSVAEHRVDLGDSLSDFTTYPPNVIALRDRMLPRLARLIRAQLAAEAAMDTMPRPLKAQMAEARKQVEAGEARQRELYRASVDAPAGEKICIDDLAESLASLESSVFTYPIEVHGLHAAGNLVEKVLFGGEVGAWVSIRPCDKTLGGKTYLGVLLGDLATGVGISYHPTSGFLTASFSHHNPAIWVPELRRIVFGYESWWGELKGPEDLRQISDADIGNVWYVRALADLTTATKAPQK